MTENFINKPNLVQLSKSKMVKALVVLDENTNRILNIIKSKFDLKDKGEAIDFVVRKYIEKRGDPELRPEFLKKLKKIKKQKPISVGTVENLRKQLNM